VQDENRPHGHHSSQDISAWDGFPYDMGLTLLPAEPPASLFIFHPQQAILGLFGAGGNWH